MVHTREIPGNITFQHIRKTLNVRPGPIDSRMGPLAFSTGITVIQKASFKDGLNDITQRMVDHPIPKRCRANHSQLFIPNEKRSIPAGTVGMRLQLVLQRQQFFFNIQTERTDIRPEAFPTLRPLKRKQQIRKGGQARKQRISHPFPFWYRSQPPTCCPNRIHS